MIYTSAKEIVEQNIEEKILSTGMTSTIVYHCHVKLNIDPDEVNLRIQGTNKKQLDDAIRLRREIEDKKLKLEEELAALNEQYKTAKEEEKQLIKEEAKRNEVKYDALKLVEKGETYYTKKDYKRAIESLNQAIKLDPNLALAYSWLGCCYNDFGDFNNSLKNFHKAIELNPKDALAYNGIGVYYSDIGNNAKAIEYYKKAMEADPKLVYPWSNMAGIYLKSNDYDKEYTKALEALDKAYELATTDGLKKDIKGAREKVIEKMNEN